MVSDHDWRLRALRQARTYLTPPGVEAEHALAQTFQRIVRGGAREAATIDILGRPIAAKRLVNVTYEAMWHGIMHVKPGIRLGDIGFAIQKFSESNGFSVVREFCGHGIGRNFHEEPQVLHYGKPGTGVELKEGMTFTVEPMVNAGKPQTKQLPDGWTVVTKDHSLSAQWEHTIAVTAGGFEILTPWPDA